jgi:uncharacterized coiled-coil DUF342 family protein
MDWIELLNVVLPIVSALAGWVVGTRKRKNDFLHDMQKSIDMLSTENRELLEELVALRKENADLNGKLASVNRELSELRDEVKSLRESKRELKDLRILRGRYEKMLSDNGIAYNSQLS